MNKPLERTESNLILIKVHEKSLTLKATGLGDRLTKKLKPGVYRFYTACIQGVEEHEVMWALSMVDPRFGIPLPQLKRFDAGCTDTGWVETIYEHTGGAFFK